MLGVIAVALAGGELELRNDDLGARLVYAQLIRGRDRNLTPEQYLAHERAKPAVGDQSHQTAARGLKEYCVKLRLLHKQNTHIYSLTPLGAAIVALQPGHEMLFALWHEAFYGLAIDHEGGTCHPYQNLLWLAQNVPGFTRTLSPLAFEVKTNEPEELARVAALAQSGNENEIRNATRTTKTNWNNAKKVLPHVATELGDLVQHGQLLIPSENWLDHEWMLTGTEDQDSAGQPPEWTKRSRSPHDTAKDSVDDIGRSDGWMPDPKKGKRRAEYDYAKTADRIYRHDMLLREAIRAWPTQQYQIHEADFDALLAFGDRSDLLEAKTLSNNVDDHMKQVRLGFGQLKFYCHFSVAMYPRPVRPVLVLERPVSNELTNWVVSEGVSVYTKDGTVFRGTGPVFE